MVSLDTAPSYRRGGDHARMTLRMRVSLGRPACLAALALAATACTFPVEGQFVGRSLADRADPTRTIVLIYNHGFSRDTAGTYKPGVPPISSSRSIGIPTSSTCWPDQPLKSSGTFGGSPSCFASTA